MAYAQVGVPTPLLVPNLTRDYGMKQHQEMWSVFGSATYQLSDISRITLGLRYFEEDKTVDHFLHKRFTGGWDYSALAGLPAGSIAFGNTAADYDAFLAGFGQVDLGGVTAGFLTEAVYAGLLGTFEHDIKNRSRNETDVNFQLTYERDVSADTMVFATYSNGTKGGGFDGRFLRTNDNPFFEYDEETADNFELGIKSTLLDGGMTLNATAFMTTVEDFQVSIFDGATAFFVQNAAEIKSRGLEVDVKWAATDALTVSFAGTYLDNEYSKFPNAPCWASSADSIRGECQLFGTPDAYRDASGETNTFSPEYAFNLNLDYRQALTGDLEGRAVLNINYSDAYMVAADLDPIYADQEAYTKYDVRLSVGQIDGEWEFAVIGKNLTEEFSGGSSNDQPLVPGNGFASTDRLRSYMAQFTYRF
jgi:outer membrane receptor protein involved in Fe transport